MRTRLLTSLFVLAFLAACSDDSSNDAATVSPNADAGGSEPSSPDGETTESPAGEGSGGEGIDTTGDTDSTDGVTFGPGTTPVNVPTAPAPTMTAPPEEILPPIERCAAATGSGDDPLIDDFEDTTFETLTRDGREGSWYPFNSANDTVTHSFIIEAISDSPVGQGYALHTSGAGFEWAGIGMGIRWGVTNDQGEWVECVYNASAYDGFRFWARGNGGAVRFTVSVPGVIPVSQGGLCPDEGPCWNNHGVDLAFGEEWEEYWLPFSDLLQPDWGPQLGALDPAELRSLQFELGTGAMFDFAIDEISFYSGEAVTPPLEDAGTGVEPTDASAPLPQDPDAGAAAPDAGVLTEVDASASDAG